MLLSKVAPDGQRHGPDVEIKGLTRDSRNVEPGFLFAAIPGEAIDGASFIPEAVKKGAVAVLAAPGISMPENISAVSYPEPRKALAQMAARFYPVQPKTLAAVTGTSGKTSVVQFTRQIWQGLGYKAAAIGTLGIMGDGIERYGSLTTPDCISLHQDLQMLAQDKGIERVALEASSHGLDQYRLDGLNISLAAFTNLSRDHLDYHKDMGAYFKTKQRLFSELLAKTGTAVLNKDIPEYETLAALVKARGAKIISFGMKDADLCLLSSKEDAQGQVLQVSVQGKKSMVPVPLAGAFQGLNVLCAAALVIANGEDAQRVIGALPRISGVRGRMESMGDINGARVYVDYAHKPDALENVLRALRPSTRGRLIALFGCGGGRDAGKRPMMGEIAARLADIVIITDDNPRMEDPAMIRAAIMKACPGAKEIGGREEAIAYGISQLKPGDTLVIAGKGHEPGQIVGNKTLPFDDAEVARRLMRSRAA